VTLTLNPDFVLNNLTQNHTNIVFCASMFGFLKRGRFRSLASLILVVNVVGELQPKRTLAASRGFLAVTRLSCYIYGWITRLATDRQTDRQTSSIASSPFTLLGARLNIWPRLFTHHSSRNARGCCYYVCIEYFQSNFIRLLNRDRMVLYCAAPDGVLRSSSLSVSLLVVGSSFIALAHSSATASS